MSISRYLGHAKVLLNQGADLLLLRLRLLNLELAQQVENAFRSAVWLALSAVLLFVGLISLLFGLNRVLDDAAALWVFFGISAVCLTVIVWVFFRVRQAWRGQGSRIAGVLQDMQNDLAYLRGQYPADGKGAENE